MSTSGDVCEPCKGTGLVDPEAKGGAICPHCEGSGLEDGTAADALVIYPGDAARTVREAGARTPEEVALATATTDMLTQFLPAPVVAKPPPVTPRAGDLMTGILGSLVKRAPRLSVEEATAQARDRGEARLLTAEADEPVRSPLDEVDPLRPLPGDTFEQHEERVVAALEKQLSRPLTVEERQQVARGLETVRRDLPSPREPLAEPDWAQINTLEELETAVGEKLEGSQLERDEMAALWPTLTPEQRQAVGVHTFSHVFASVPTDPTELTEEEEVARREMLRNQEAYDKQLRLAKQQAARRRSLVKKGFTTGLLGLGDDTEHDWAKRVRIDDRPAEEIKQEIVQEREIDDLTAGTDAGDLFSKI